MPATILHINALHLGVNVFALMLLIYATQRDMRAVAFVTFCIAMFAVPPLANWLDPTIAAVGMSGPVHAIAALLVLSRESGMLRAVGVLAVLKATLEFGGFVRLDDSLLGFKIAAHHHVAGVIIGLLSAAMVAAARNIRVKAVINE